MTEWLKSTIGSLLVAWERRESGAGDQAGCLSRCTL